MAVSSIQGLAFKTLESELLREEHVANGEMALRTKTPPSYALAIRVQLINIDRSKVSDEIASSCIASRHLKPSERIELLKLGGAEVRLQEFPSSLLRRAATFTRFEDNRQKLEQAHSLAALKRRNENRLVDTLVEIAQ
jgi:hypothetical protein